MRVFYSVQLVAVFFFMMSQSGAVVVVVTDLTDWSNAIDSASETIEDLNSITSDTRVQDHVVNVGGLTFNGAGVSFDGSSVKAALNAAPGSGPSIDGTTVLDFSGMKRNDDVIVTLPGNVTGIAFAWKNYAGISSDAALEVRIVTSGGSVLYSPINDNNNTSGFVGYVTDVGVIESIVFEETDSTFGTFNSVDNFRYAVVPEPSSFVTIIGLIGMSCVGLSRKRSVER